MLCDIPSVLWPFPNKKLNCLFLRKKTLKKDFFCQTITFSIYCNHSQRQEATYSVALGMICLGQEVFSLSEIYLFTLHATIGEDVADDVEA